ncbi:MAG: hypothetical protein MRZ79_14080 [Bacteroidia bacterium]|nr:hypothetical protein [Bacteroidia bacterium]
MKKNLLIMLLLAAFCSSVWGQRINYRAWVKLENGDYPQKLYLKEVKDSSLLVGFISPKEFESVYKEFNYSEIYRIGFKKKGKMLKETLIWGGSLGIAGALIGYSLGDDDCSNNLCLFVYSREEKALISGMAGLTIGTLIGVVPNLFRVNINIDRNYQKFNQQKEALRKYQHR